MNIFTLRLVPVALALSLASSVHALSPVACTMDAKMCPDGSYVGRQGPNCEFEACPGEVQACTKELKICPDGTGVGRTGPNCAFEACPGEAPNCAPYVCANGATHPRCGEDGHVINYFAAPCHMDGGEVAFSDVPDMHANAEAIAYVKAEGIVEGYADGTFKPDATINRAEFVKILVGAMDDDRPVCKIAPFEDVDQSAWYATYVHKARCWGLVEGYYPDGTFRPGNQTNFVEAAKILSGAYDLVATTKVPACKEGDCTWYRKYVLMLEMKNAIPTSITGLDQAITRGEMAEMIYRLKSANNEKPSGTYEELEGGNSTVGFFDPNFPVRFDYPMAWKDMIDTDNSAPWFIGLGPACDGQTCALILGNHRLGIVSMLEDDPLLRSGSSGWESYVNTKGHVVYAKATVGVCAEYEAVIVSDIASARVFGDCLNDDPLYAEAAKGIVDSMDFYKNW